MQEVKRERSGWRDERISKRHRDWGWDLPIADLDWIVCEYDNKTPVAIIEYKHERAAPVPRKADANWEVLIKLGNMAGLPVFGVRYADDLSWYNVAPENSRARQWLTRPQAIKMSELDFVAFLYRLRGREIPTNILTKLKR